MEDALRKWLIQMLVSCSKRLKLTIKDNTGSAKTVMQRSLARDPWFLVLGSAGLKTNS
jgi:hypothetical protein